MWSGWQWHSARNRAGSQAQAQHSPEEGPKQDMALHWFESHGIRIPLSFLL